MTAYSVSADPGSALNLERRLGCGRLCEAGWLDDGRVVVATAAELWVWDVRGGTLKPLVQAGTRGMDLRQRAGLAALVAEAPIREVRLVSLADGAMVQRFHTGERSLIYAAALSPAAEALAVGLGSHQVTLWDVRSGERRACLTHPETSSSFDGQPEVLAWSPDGARLASASRDHKLWVWDVASGAMMGEWALPFGARGLLWMPDGMLLAAMAFGGGTITHTECFLAVVDPACGEVVHLLETPNEAGHRVGDMRALAHEPSRQLCAAGGDGEVIHVFDTATWQLAAQLAAPPDVVEPPRMRYLHSLAFSPDGAQLLATVATNVNRGAEERRFGLEVWATDGWRLAARLDDFTGAVGGLALGTGGRIYAACDDGLRIYPSAEGGQPTLLRPRVRSRAKWNTDRLTALRHVALSPDEHAALVSWRSHSGEAGAVDLASGAVGELLDLPQKQVEALAWHPDGQQMAACGAAATIWKTGRKSAVRKLSFADRAVGAAASSDGKFGFCSWDGTLSVVWGARFAQGLVGLRPPGPARRLTALAFSPDGSALAVAGGLPSLRDAYEDRRARVFVCEIATQGWRELPLEAAGLSAVAWSPDGQLIAAGDGAGRVVLLRAADGAVLASVSGHGDAVTALHFTADGARLVSASRDGSLGVWSVDG
ncbi:hypothetical protein F8S13_20665 [Chloroflexia bacterium SDU3-3]|nr:hypothetical protein F8S13_20665 [Chloroflexia bacterium SDU3-3]